MRSMAPKPPKAPGGTTPGSVAGVFSKLMGSGSAHGLPPAGAVPAGAAVPLTVRGAPASKKGQLPTFSR